jgi:DNA-binding regulatory protein, YebC/PmpR family
MAGHSKWANIKHRKGRQDALRAKITTKIAREIAVAVKIGGADPALNMKLKLALQKAKEGNVPKDNIQRAIQKGLGGTDNNNYEEIRYEGYGPGGVAVFVDVLSDNRNRTAADIRHLFSKNGGNMGESGSVAWMFDSKGVFLVDRRECPLNEEEFMMVALEAGAEDFVIQEEEYEISTLPEDFSNVLETLENLNIPTKMAQVTMVPQTTVTLDSDAEIKMIKLLEALEDHDDVQDVYSNFGVTEE